MVRRELGWAHGHILCGLEGGAGRTTNTPGTRKLSLPRWQNHCCTWPFLPRKTGPHGLVGLVGLSEFWRQPIPQPGVHSGPRAATFQRCPELKEALHGVEGAVLAGVSLNAWGKKKKKRRRKKKTHTFPSWPTGSLVGNSADCLARLPRPPGVGAPLPLAYEPEEQPRVEASSGHRLVFSAHARRSGNAACDFPVSRYLRLNECGSFSSALSLEDSLSSAFPSRIPHAYLFFSVNGHQLSQWQRGSGVFFFYVFFVFPRNALCIAHFPSWEGPIPGSTRWIPQAPQEPPGRWRQAGRWAGVRRSRSRGACWEPRPPRWRLSQVWGEAGQGRSLQNLSISEVACPWFSKNWPL